MPSVAQIAANFEQFLAQQKLPDDRRAVAAAAIEAFLQFDERRDPALLGPLVTAARSPHKVVFEVGASLLGVLAQAFDTARQAWLSLANDSSVTARFTAVAFLDKEMPPDFTLALVGRMLGDKSARVRKKAIEVAGTLDHKVLAPEIERLSAEDPDDGVRVAAAHELPILRDGYRLEKTSDDGYRIHFRTPSSYVSVPLWGEPTPEAIRALIEEETAGRR